MNPNPQPQAALPGTAPAAAPLPSVERLIAPPPPSASEKIPAQWTWHYRTLTRLRDRLSRAHTEHASEANAPAELRGVDLLDTTQERLDRDLLWAELAAEDDKRLEVERALQRIRDGVYGFCEETGHPIPLERLRAVPWTRYSRTAAARHEHRNVRPGML